MIMCFSYAQMQKREKREGKTYEINQNLLQGLQVHLWVRPKMRGISHPDSLRHFDGVRVVDVQPDESVLAQFEFL